MLIFCTRTTWKTFCQIFENTLEKYLLNVSAVEIIGITLILYTSMDFNLD